MSEPNATPAPLTMTPEQEREDREIVANALGLAMRVQPEVAASAFTELDATRAKLAQAEAQTALMRDACEIYRNTQASLASQVQAAEVRVAALSTGVYALIAAERKRQDEKWGEQNHVPVVWSAILSEENGEVAKAALEKDWTEYLRELVQCAAVCVAAHEAAARGTMAALSTSQDAKDGGAV